MKTIEIIKKYFSFSAAKKCAAFKRKQLKENSDVRFYEVKVCKALEYSSPALRKELGRSSVDDYIVVVTYDDLKMVGVIKCVTKNSNNMAQVKHVPAKILKKEGVVKMIPIMTFIKSKVLNRNFDYTLFSSKEVISFYKREFLRTAA